MRAAGTINFKTLSQTVNNLKSRAPTRRELPPFGAQLKVPIYIRLGLVSALIAFSIIYGAAFALFIPYLIAPLVIPFIFLSFIVVWSLPQQPSGMDHVLLPILFLLFVSIVLWPSYLAIAIPNLPRITISRAVGVPLSVLFLINLSISRHFKHGLKHSLIDSLPLFAMLLVFFLIQTASLFFSSNKSASVNLYVATTINCTIVYFIGSYGFIKVGAPERFGGLICFMAVVLAIIAFWERHLNHLPWVGHVPSFLQVNDPVVERILAGTARQGGAHRSQATFTTALGLSEYFGLSMPFFFFFATEGYSKHIRLISIFSIPVVFFATVITQARTGLLGILVAVLVYPALWIFLEWRKQKTSLLVFSIVASSPILLIGALVAAFLTPGIRIRLLGGGGEQLSTQARVVQVHMGIPKILSHPWGYGIGQAAETLGYTNAAGMLTIDSYPLRVALEYGVLGLAVWFLLLGIGLLSSFKGALLAGTARESRLFIPLTVAILSYMLMKINFAQEDNQPLIYAILGMVTALGCRERLMGTGNNPKSSLESIAK
jgi:hypothetical protein